MSIARGQGRACPRAGPDDAQSGTVNEGNEGTVTEGMSSGRGAAALKRLG
ncbi:hypothetical protein GCM10009825_39410 [Arthrobacter humicola]|uniref:Uncharacterized protein n=1 Tax=Arthrobacter humicola TaxID=409291 RepID=A0ABP5LF71_9MICC